MASLAMNSVYPPTRSQSFRPYHDTTSSEEASIHGEDETFLEKSVPTPARTWRQRCCNSSTISIIISTIIATSLILLLLITTKGHPIRVLKQSDLFTSLSLHGHGPTAPSIPKPSRNEAEVKKLHCGSTPAEAGALGCKFDVMSFAWTPAPCYDHSLSQSFLSAHGPWTFYLDHNATIPLPMSDLSNHMVVWTEHHYHVVHCLYAWERIHRASFVSSSSSSETGTGTGTETEMRSLLLPREMGSLHHTVHCVGLLAEGVMAEKRKVNAVADLVFEGCIGLD